MLVAEYMVAVSFVNDVANRWGISWDKEGICLTVSLFGVSRWGDSDIWLNPWLDDAQPYSCFPSGISFTA